MLIPWSDGNLITRKPQTECRCSARSGANKVVPFLATSTPLISFKATETVSPRCLSIRELVAISCSQFCLRQGVGEGKDDGASASSVHARNSFNILNDYKMSASSNVGPLSPAQANRAVRVQQQCSKSKCKSEPPPGFSLCTSSIASTTSLLKQFGARPTA